MEPFLEFARVFYKYNISSISEDYALKNINLKINRGDFVAIIGANGSGKSTLTKHLNAMLVPTSGKVFVSDIDTEDEKETYNIRSRIGLVLQNPDNQIVSSIVEEDVAFGPENLGVNPNEIRNRVDSALKSVGMFSNRKDPVWGLSGGQKQRVAIAGVLAMKLECIVLDEVTSMLDPKGKREVLKTLKFLNKNKNITVVMITHDMAEAVLANKIFVINEGSLVASGSREEIFSNIELIKKCNLCFSEPMKIIFSLKEAGFNVKEMPFCEDDCVKILDKFIKTRGIKKING